jgi:dipeptidyl aminopeptidase/acylaminoacyl peptidase
MHRWIAALTLLAAWFCAGRGEGPARDHDITVADYFTQAELFEVAVSPDGKWVAYSEGRWQESSNDRRSDLWIAEVATQQVRRLTFDRASDHSLKWSADGKWLYFAGTRQRDGEKKPPYDGKTQVWRLPPRGAEPTAVTRVEGGIGQFELAGNGETIFYTTEKESIDGPWKEMKQRYKDLHYGDGINKFTRVWKLNLESWRAELVLDGRRVVREMAATPDGHRLALITTPDEKVVSFEGQSQVDIFDVRAKRSTTLPNKTFRADAPSPFGWLERLAWSPDGTELAFTVIFDGYPAEVLIAEWMNNEVLVRRLKRPEGLSLRGYGSPLQWRGQDLLFLGEEKARVRLCSAAEVQGGKQGPIQVITPGDVQVQAFHFNDSGTKGVAIIGDASHLADVFLVEKDTSSRRLTKVNPQSDRWKMPQVSLVSWKGAHGDPVEGILELPPDARPGEKLPLIVEIHGGPTMATYLAMQFWIYGRTLLPARGYAILSPNYRGSTGYGDHFLTELVGHENDIEVEDILKGVDALVERGIADPDRLGVMGWSNGGYLTNCLITKTTRFKAASSGASIVDTVLEWGSNDEPAYAISFKQGFPWSRPDNYRKTSPTYQLDKIRTPTLIHVGGSDERCPPSNSRMLYRALKEYVRVPTELLIYPGEPHGLATYQHRKAKMEWDLAWFEKYLGKNADKNKAEVTDKQRKGDGRSADRQR